MTSPFARVEKLEYSEDYALQFPDGPKDEDGQTPIVLTDNPLRECVEMDAKTINEASHARVSPLVEALERIERRTLLDAEGPELRCQNENNYKDARKALEEFRGK